MKKIITSLILFTGVITFSAAAQSAADRATIQNTIGFGPRLGYYQAADADEGNFYGGLQTRIRMGAIVGLEGSVEYRGEQQYGVDDLNIRVRTIPLTASLMLFAPISYHVAPYGLAGLGAYYIQYKYSDTAKALGFTNESDWFMGYHLGFGVELAFNEFVALSLDYRYLFLNPDNDLLDIENVINNADLSGNVFTASLMFYF